MKAETKYELGNNIYYMEDNKVQETEITRIYIDIFHSLDGSPNIVYTGANGNRYLQKEIYITKSELLKSL